MDDRSATATVDLAQAPTRSNSKIARAGSLIDSVVVNPNSVDMAMQILDTLAEIGKSLPFIAPAFVMLKIIIDLEKQAQDVDAKCNDLLQRITFMLGHLPALQKIEIMSTTRQVIDRMNEVLKDAASLISAYRRQSRVARRLKISNRERFTACAENINTCSNDLLMSLQIHQTVQLDILTREVPTDDIDVAARTFIDSHGGNVEAVTHDRELVKEFANQQQFVMDDSVMEQLNANITDSIQQNHAQLEHILRTNVSSAVSDSLKNIAMEMHALESEQRFICVQCNKEFTSHRNGPKACSFHRAEYDSWSKSFPCCGAPQPCQFGAHRAKHHCDYPYETFFPRARDLSYYVDTHEYWAIVEDTNLETDVNQKASVGQLLRWKTRGDFVQDKTLLIVVGKVWYQTPYYLNTFTAKELEEIANSVRHSQRTLIFRTSQDENEYAMAEWVLSNSEIIGVRVAAKSATSANPWSRFCPINITTCTKSEDISTTSQGGIGPFTPASPYILPKTVIIGPIINDTQARPVRTDFKTVTSPFLPIILKTMSSPPLSANPLANSTVDFFDGKVAIFNNSPAASSDLVTIASISAFYRMVGDPGYLPADSCKLLEGLEMMPMTINPRQSWQITFQVAIPRTEEDKKLRISWWNRAFLARNHPVRIKLVVEDIEGRQCSLVLEYLYKPFPLANRNDSDLGFFFFDNPLTHKRNHVRVESKHEADDVVKIEFNNVTVKTLKLERAVHQALKSGQTEVDLNIGIEKDDGDWEWKVWALVDTSCRSVYAFKIIVQEGQNVPVKRYGCIGYVSCPKYGEVSDEKRPIKYATEIAALPPLEPYTTPIYPQDDDFDDFKPPPPVVHESYPASKPMNSSGDVAVPNELLDKLTSIDANLANLGRIAAALEKLVEAIPGSSTGTNARKRPIARRRLGATRTKR